MQKREFLIGRRLGHSQMGSESQGKSGIVLKFFLTDAGIERHHLHAPLVGIESEHRQIGDHAERAAGKQAACAPRVAAAQVAGAGDEIHVLDEAALLVLHRHDHVREAGNVVAATRSR